MADMADLKRARRIVILSRANGTSSATIAAVALAGSIAARDWIAIIASIGVCAGAALEIAGSVSASRRDAGAARVLVASQAVALASILCLIFRITIAVSPAFVLSWIGESSREAIRMIYPGPGEADRFVMHSARIVLGIVALVAAIFESGMALFYASSARVFQRLTKSPPPVLERR